MSFEALALTPPLLRTLAHIGFTEPTPIQKQAIPQVLSGTDLIGIAQTGTGKTAAFVLPILHNLLSEGPASQQKAPRALVVAPTRELAAQIEETARTLAQGTRIRTVAVFGGVAERPQIDALRRGVDIIVATPGRLLDLKSSKHVDLSRVRIVVLDEADRMLDMGFLPQIRKVIAALPVKRQTLYFSATFPKAVEAVAREMLRNPQMVEIGRRSNPVDSVRQELILVDRSRKADLLLHVLKDPALDSVLVFCRTKHGADKIARKLGQAGITTAPIHGNRSQSQRTRALADFKNGRIRVLVATDIAARGIDVEEISHVINLDFPPQAEDYVHRIGRTGRASATGDAISFVTPDDEGSVRDVEKLTGRRLERKTLPGFQTAAPAAPRSAGRPFPGSRPQTATDDAHRRPAARPGRTPPAAAPGRSRASAPATRRSRFGR